MVALEIVSLVLYATVLSASLMVNAVNAMDVEEIQSLFRSEHCVEASLITISRNQDSGRMLDSTYNMDKQIISNTTEATLIRNAKSLTSKINELAQYNDILYSYKLVSEEGPPHAKLYKVILTLGDENYEGSGAALKKAQYAAAALALENTLYEHPPEKIKLDQDKSQTPTVTLNNIAMKLGIGASYFLLNGKEEEAIDSYGAIDEAYGKSKSYYPKLNSTTVVRIPVEEAQVSGPFAVRVKLGDLSYDGFGHTIQAARHDAALKAIRDMEKQALFKDNVCSSEASVDECKSKKESLKSPITRVHEAAQQLDLAVEFNVVSETGPSHKKVFVTECKLGDFVTEGEGNSKKESKRLAAVKMIGKLPKLLQTSSENLIIQNLKNKKNRKQKKNSVIKKNVKNLADSLTDILSSVWSSNDPIAEDILIEDKETISKSQLSSMKNTLLELGSTLDIQIHFTDLNQPNGDDVYCLMSLGIHPPQICLGKGPTREKSYEVAALHGLKFLQKSGVLEKAGFSQYKQSDYIDDYVVEEEIQYRTAETFEKK